MSCENINLCGGCTFRELTYNEQLTLKENKVKEALVEFFDEDTCFQSIVPSPLSFEYRNKMEFTFGDKEKNGDLMLGLHQKKTFYNILDASKCDLISDDLKDVVFKTTNFFRNKNIKYYHKRIHKGYLRNLVLRKSFYENKILINLVVSSNYENKLQTEEELLKEYVDYLKSDSIIGILKTTNDYISDAIKVNNISVLFGRDYLIEQVSGYKFFISPFSFFQTNTYCVEKLYQKVKDFVLSCGNNKILYDLFCGTGTIAQIMSKHFDKVFGVEIVEEAVEKAIFNAKYNNIDNCIFLTYDVNKFIDDLIMKNIDIDLADVIILDPPREGIIFKSLSKILSLGVKNIVYISCKLQSLVKDINIIKEYGYRCKRICPVDMFPYTDNIETVCLLSNRKPDARVKIDVDLEDYYRIKDEQKKNKASE